MSHPAIGTIKSNQERIFLEFIFPPRHSDEHFLTVSGVYPADFSRAYRLTKRAIITAKKS